MITFRIPLDWKRRSSESLIWNRLGLYTIFWTSLNWFRLTDGNIIFWSWFQDLQELTDLHKELEKSPEAAGCAADLKKAKVGLINLQAYMNQVDCIEFAAAINNQVISFVHWIFHLRKLSAKG